MRAAQAHVASALAPFATAVADLPAEVVAGCSGTIETLAAMARAKAGRTARPHRSTMTRRSSTSWSTPSWRRRPLDDLKALPGMEPSRADIIVGGALIVQGAMDAFGWSA